MFKAMQANDMPLIESLWQAILTVTIHCRVSLSISEKMLWSMQHSEKLKAENLLADNFLSFANKAGALLESAKLTHEKVPTFFETRIEPSPVGKSNAPDPRRIAGADRFREMISSPATAWKIKRPRADKLMGPISFPNHLAEKQTPPTPGASLGQLGSRRPFPPTISHKMKRPRPQVHRWGRWAQGCQFHPRVFYRKGNANNKKKAHQERLGFLLEKDVRYNRAKINKTMLAGVLCVSRCSSKAIRIMRQIERNFGREVLTSGYNKLIRIYQVCQLYFSDLDSESAMDLVEWFLIYLAWALKFENFPPREVTLEFLDKKRGDSGYGQLYIAFGRKSIVNQVWAWICDLEKIETAGELYAELDAAIKDFADYEAFEAAFKKKEPPAAAQEPSAASIMDESQVCDDLDAGDQSA